MLFLASCRRAHSCRELRRWLRVVHLLSRVRTEVPIEPRGLSRSRLVALAHEVSHL